MPKPKLKIIKRAIRLTSFLSSIFGTSQSSSRLLMFCTLASILVSNIPAYSESYIRFWETSFLDIAHIHLPTSPLLFINDLLMPIFFFTVGYEIRHELYAADGSINSTQKALLPMVCALGGVLVPALIYSALNYGHPTLSGWAIPTATDIAFALAALSILGNKIPNGAKVLLMALAIFDDIIAVFIIALFYTHGSIGWIYLLGAVGLGFAIYGCSRYKHFNKSIGVQVLLFFLALGLWYMFFLSGIHPTLSGIVLVFLLPDRVAHRIFNALMNLSAFIVLPLFVLANTAIPIDLGQTGQLLSPVALGIMLGLLLGKPIGILTFAFLSNKVKLTRLPEEVTMAHLLKIGVLAGIGFTMSILVAHLSFEDEQHIKIAKLSIIISSLLAGVIGIMYTRWTSKKIK